MKKIEDLSLSDKIAYGLSESFKQLVKTKKQQNGTFVWCIDGKITHVKAKDVKLK
jgi:hypothetical protein